MRVVVAEGSMKEGGTKENPKCVVKKPCAWRFKDYFKGSHRCTFGTFTITIPMGCLLAG